MSLLRKRAAPDPVAAQLKSLAKQGAGMARVAHLFAGMLIILFSAASFIALGSEALARFEAATARGAFDLPDAISLAVVVLIVPAFDWGMLYAAHHVNLLMTRQADKKEMRVHIGVIVLATLVEGASYIYMSILYEHPATFAAWAIICVRGMSAPLLAVYLAMARPLPVTPRDIFYQGELATGAGLLRDVAKAANNQDAPLHEKMALYDASALMSETDRARLAKMMHAVSRQGGKSIGDDPLAESTPHHTGLPAPVPSTPPGGWHPTNGGTPLAMSPVSFPGLDDDTFPGTHQWESPDEVAETLAANGFDLDSLSPEESARVAGLYATARYLLNANPLTNKRELRDALGCRRTLSNAMYDVWYYSGGMQRIAQAKAAKRESVTVDAGQVAQ